MTKLTMILKGFLKQTSLFTWYRTYRQEKTYREGASSHHVKQLIEEAVRMIKREHKIASGAISGKELIELIGKENPVILDIGCNDGTHTLWFLELFSEALVYCFEPDPRARKRFAAKVKDKRAVLFDVAIADTDGVTEFYLSGGTPSSGWAERLPEGWDLSGSIRKPKNHLKVHPWCTFDKKIEVKTRKLDTWVQEQGVDVIDFIWADVQGAEKDLIKGGRETLKRTRYFYTEYSNLELYEGQINFRQLLKLLPDFEVIHRYESDVWLRNKALR